MMLVKYIFYILVRLYVFNELETGECSYARTKGKDFIAATTIYLAAKTSTLRTLKENRKNNVKELSYKIVGGENAF